MRINNQYSGDAGQLLIEAAVSAGVMVIALTGILALTSNALGLNRVVTDQYVAADLAAEGIEMVKNLLDQNAFKIKNGCGSGCTWKDGLDESNPSNTTTNFYQMDFNDSDLGEQTSEPIALRLAPTYGAYVYEDCFIPPDANPCESTGPTKFFRKIEIGSYDDGDSTTDNDDVITVHSFVEWTGRGGAKNQIHLEDHFFYWQQFSE